MLDDHEFEEIQRRFEAFDLKRETIIKESRDILKLSKQAIYGVHRDDLAKAQAQLIEAGAIKARLEKEIGKDPDLRTGGFSGALEEYVEARCLLGFVEHGRILTMKELDVLPEEYLLGLSDLTGELMRRAVIAATKHRPAEVKRIHEAVEGLYGQFVKFDFRNGELRRKYDSIKYNLQKVEQMLYDLSLNKRSADEKEAEE